MKKFTAFMLSGAIGLCTFAPTPYIAPDPISVCAADAYTSGNYQGMIYRKYDNQVVISGSESGLSGALTIPDSIDGLPVTAILSKSFYGQKGITSVSIPASVALIGDEAFNLVDIKPSAPLLYYAESKDKFAQLTEINVAPGNQYYASIDGVLYSKDLSTIIQYPHAKEGGYTAPSTVRVIKEHAFDYCAVESVSLPEGITEIPNYGFMRCVYLSSINIPGTVTKIGMNAFQNDHLESIVLPPSVTEVSSNAFFCCVPLNSITIENPGCKIVGGKLTLCNNTTDFTYTGTIRGYEGSYAQDFANKNNCNFESLGSAPSHSPTTTTASSDQPPTTTHSGSGSIDPGILTETAPAEETTTTTTEATTTTTTTTEETTTTTTSEIPWYETSTTTTTTEIPWYATSTTTTTRYIEWWETSTTTESTTTTSTTITTQTTTTTTAYVPVTTTTKAPEKVTYYLRFIDDSNGNTLSGVKYRVYSFDNNDEDYGEMTSDNDYTLFNFYSDSFDIELLEVPNGYVLDEPALRTFIHSGRNVEIRIKKDYSPVTTATTSTSAETSTTQTQTTAAPVTTASETSPYVPETTAASHVNTKTTYYIRFVDAENNDPVSGIRYRVNSHNADDPDYGEKISSEFQESFDFFSDSFTIQMLYVPDEYSYETVEPLTYTNARRIVTVRVKKKSELPQETTTAAPETQTTASQTETATTSAETTTTAPVIDPPHGIPLGDVDGSGNVDASDASEVLMEYALLSTERPSHFSEEQKKAADVNGDGSTDASDASCILAYYAYRSTGGSKDIETFLRENGII